MKFSNSENMRIQNIPWHACFQVTILTAWVFMLSACAVVSTIECPDTDWRIKGVIAGTSGLSVDEAQDNFERCGVGLQSVRNEYIKGYNEGIESYCTKTRGFNIGLQGDTYHGICPEELEESFLVGYHVGADLFSADADLQEAKIAFASIPSSFIGTPPSAEHNRFLLETFDQTRDTARALVSQMKWQQPGPSEAVRKTSYGRRDLTTVINRCEAKKKQAEELGFVADDVC